MPLRLLDLFFFISVGVEKITGCYYFFGLLYLNAYDVLDSKFSFD